MSSSRSNFLQDILQRAGLRSSDSRLPKVLAVLAVLVLVGIFLRWGGLGAGSDGLSFGDEVEGVEASGPGETDSSQGAASAASTVLAVEEPSLVLVYVSGAVLEPGVYKPQKGYRSGSGTEWDSWNC